MYPLSSPCPQYTRRPRMLERSTEAPDAHVAAMLAERAARMRETRLDCSRVIQGDPDEIGKGYEHS